MKTSNKILFITGIVIAVILLIGVIGSRIFLNKYTDSYESEDTNYTYLHKEKIEAKDNECFFYSRNYF